MRGFRSRLILLLIVYFAGFATAIYTLAPVPENPDADSPVQKSFAYSVLKSDDFAGQCNKSLHRCMDFVKDVSIRAGDFIREKIDERKAGSS